MTLIEQAPRIIPQTSRHDQPTLDDDVARDASSLPGRVTFQRIAAFTVAGLVSLMVLSTRM